MNARLDKHVADQMEKELGARDAAAEIAAADEHPAEPPVEEAREPEHPSAAAASEEEPPRQTGETWADATDDMEIAEVFEAAGRDEQLHDGPAVKSEGRLQTPERAPAMKRIDRSSATSSRDTRRIIGVDAFAIDDGGRDDNA